MTATLHGTGTHARMHARTRKRHQGALQSCACLQSAVLLDVLWQGRADRKFVWVWIDTLGLLCGDVLEPVLMVE